MQLTWQSGAATFDDGGGGVELRQVPIRVLIPDSRLAAFVGDFFVSDPIVSDGDDVYEVNLTPDDRNDQKARPQSADVETEHMFLNFVAGKDANDVQDFIEYAVKNHWFGGKDIFMSLDKSKTILDRQTKLVMHNYKPQNTLDYHVTNASQPMKKTNFILEEWPYITLNKPLIAKGTDDELAPWLRSRNRQLNVRRSQTSNYITPAQSAFLTNGNGMLLGNGKLQQNQQQKQYQPQNQYQHHNYQQHDHQQHNHQQHNHQQHNHQQHNRQQHNHQQRNYQQHIYQQFQYQPRIPQQYQHRIQIQHMPIYYPPPLPPPPPPPQQVFMYGQPPIRPYLANFGLSQGSIHIYQRFPKPFLPLKHYQLDPNNNDSSSATTNTQQ